MPNIKSAVKRVKIIKSKTLNNSIQKSVLKTSIRKCKESIANNDSDSINAFKNAIKSIDKAVSKNILHRNTAARKKSKLARAFNSCSK